MSKEESYPPQDKIVLYDRLIATNPMIERKGKTTPYTSANGNMFSYLSTSGTLALRLPKAERETFLKEFNTTLDEQHGAVMKEYVRVPDELFEKTEELRLYLEMSFAYVNSLKPKATTRK